MSDDGLDYDDLDALLEDGNENLNSDDSEDTKLNDKDSNATSNSNDEQVDFNTVIGNTMSRLNNMKLNDTKADGLKGFQESIANGFLNGDESELFNDLIMMMQTKENFYGEILNLRNRLKEWIEQNSNSEIIEDRKLQLDNLNKRISIYERKDYTDAKYGNELKELALEYVQIPHPFVIDDQQQEHYKLDESDELLELLSKELITKETIYEPAIEYRENLKQWVKEHPDADERVLESRKQEIKIYDEVIAVYESPDYSPDNKMFNEKVMNILDKTKYLYEPIPLNKNGITNKDSDTSGSAPYHELKQEFFDTIESFTTKAMETLNNDDKDGTAGITSQEQKALLQEMEQECSQQ